MHDIATRLLASYLTERTQRVKISDTYSDWINIKKAVPQGLVLGPSLLYIFINDLYGFIKGATYKYVDDNILAYISNNLTSVKTVRHCH